ncbi:GNAT family N-acetyltransferase [Musicola paradisiaca]|uniref:GCN5-related N-acetyltransferase n=1 Tax=Musicola paradisiaca (strain Ech703) TaxID=579405 RepID=C6CA96_MUSP7|nr:GNAT family N-acetyltransferase [Musicola paradisiaca]ACS84571.1 GCN5-related N-acetyltransferase [Musicola paradisiaca Ech703]
MATIGFLADYPQFEQPVTDWLWQAFGDGLSRDVFASVVHHSMDKKALPLTFVALEAGQLVGTVGLWRCDLISRQDLTPWLAALYVDDAWRDRGLGRELQRFVLEYSRDAGFDDLYLYATFSGYYEKHGWRYIGDAPEYPDKTVRIYHQSLTSVVND